MAVPLRRKSKVPEEFVKFRTWFEKQYEVTIKWLHSDNGGEYVGMEGYLDAEGIRYSRAAPYTPEQNGIAERMNRSLVEMIRAMLKQSGLSPKFWVEALLTATDIKNHTIMRTLNNICPLEKLTGFKPTVRHFRPFGCLVYIHVPKEKRRKLDDKAQSGVLMRCLPHRNYKIYIPDNNKVHISPHVRFVERNFPAKKMLERGANKLMEVDLADEDNDEVVVDLNDNWEDGLLTLQAEDSDYETITESSFDPENPPTFEDVMNELALENDIEYNMQTFDHQEGPQEIGRRYPNRDRRPPERFSFYLSSESDHRKLESCGFYSLAVPKSYKDPMSEVEAMKDPYADEWKKAIKAELDALRENKTWKLMKLPHGRKALGCKFVFKVKRFATGKFERFKARLVVQGFMQIEGFDYHETYAPVVDFTTIRVALTIAALTNMHVHQLDVTTAFLNGELEEEVYMKQPKGHEEPGAEDLVCRLLKSLYGLKQAPRIWYKTFCKDLKGLGFEVVQDIECLFVRIKEGSVIYIMAYVDDFLIMTSDMENMRWIKSELFKLYKLRDVGEVSSFLGVEINRDRQNSVIKLN